MPASDLFREISSLESETINQDTINIDQAPTLEVLRMINREDQKVAAAVESQLEYIAAAVDKISEAFRKGGRLFYVGAGTSGRLGVVDASECPPTFGTPPELVQGIIAGGNAAMFQAQEGAEDRKDLAVELFERYHITDKDVLCGIAASGRTPYVLAALNEARKRNVFTVMLSTVSRSQLEKLGVVADIMICPEVGPEAIAGSTRMKSGTAQKLVLNMLTTASMVKLGKTFGNVMVDLQLTNAKLGERAKKTLMTLTGLDYDAAEKLLKRCEGQVKTALICELAAIEPDKARLFLDRAGGFVKEALKLTSS